MGGQNDSTVQTDPGARPASSSHVREKYRVRQGNTDLQFRGSPGRPGAAFDDCSGSKVTWI